VLPALLPMAVPMISVWAIIAAFVLPLELIPFTLVALFVGPPPLRLVPRAFVTRMVRPPPVRLVPRAFVTRMVRGPPFPLLLWTSVTVISPPLPLMFRAAGAFSVTVFMLPGLAAVVVVVVVVAVVAGHEGGFGVGDRGGHDGGDEEVSELNEGSDLHDARVCDVYAI